MMDNSQGIFSQLPMAVAGGIVTILLVAIWNQIAAWVWVQLGLQRHVDEFVGRYDMRSFDTAYQMSLMVNGMDGKG